MDDDRLDIASTEKTFHEREQTTMRETVTYIADVKEAFLDEPAKFDEFFKLMKDVCDHKIDEANGSAMMAEIIKGHPNLLLRLGVFFPKYSVNKHKAESSNNKRNRAANFMENLEARFQGDGGHVVNSVLQIIRMYTIEGNKSKNEAYHEVVALLQGHVDLIMEFGEYFSDILSQPKYAKLSTITITSPKAEQRAASDNNKRIRVANFITKLKARFQGDDRHVYESFLEILTMYQEGNKSVNDLYQEVIALLQGHEDLVMEFADVLKKPTDPSGSKSNANFMENLEARFQGDGGHVVKSVLQILRMYTIEGNKSKNEAYHEVVALLQGHVDLIMEFGEYFSDKLSQPKYA